MGRYYTDLRQNGDRMGKYRLCDLFYGRCTGLKYVNDTMGHEAGDRLILNACACRMLQCRHVGPHHPERVR